MFKKYTQFIIIVLPIMILLAASTYISYGAWQKYNTNLNLKKQLNNTKLLQSFEHSVLNEIVCVATMSQHKDLIAKVCDKTKTTTDSFMQQIMQQTNDTSLYTLEKELYNMRNSIKDSGISAVEKLVNGDLDKKMKKFLDIYTSSLKNYSDDISQKEFIRLYGQISDISYATESEKALVSYYLSLEKPIPAKNLIYWGKVVSSSQIPEMDEKQVFALYDELQKIWQNPKLQTTLRGIEDIRMDIMSHASTGNYASNVAEWVSFINQKQKVLNSVEGLLLNNILNAVDKSTEKKLLVSILGLVFGLLSLFALLAFILYQRRTNNQNLLLDDLLIKVHGLSSENEKIEISGKKQSQKLAYEYIGSSYQALHDKEKDVYAENKAKNAFFTNMTYEIRTPLDSILGYIKLLKETPLSVEQSNFVSIVESNSENLDIIMSKAVNSNKAYEKKLAIVNSSFNFIKKMESVIETFAIKADRKDIVLGAFIDPDLPEKIIGDSTRLSQVFANLISNALEVTSAYGAVDVFVEKVAADTGSITVKFLVKDSGIGFDTQELNSISEAFKQPDINKNISGIEMQNLNISNKIIRRMGGKLEIESKKGEGTIFFFTLTLEKSAEMDVDTYPNFEGLKVGLALPSRNLERQIDKNLEDYIKYLGGEFSIYYHDNLFESNKELVLPDLMLIYHNYARLEGELEAFSNLECKIALITTGSLRSRIDSDNYHFSSIVYSPITMSKTARILAKSKLEQSDISQEAKQSSEKFNNIHALVVEDNVISQKLIKNDLERIGIDVKIAPNGREAFEMRRENDFDIIFMDIDMPEMDGMEATRKILYYEGINQFKHVPIVALIVNSLEGEEEKYLKAGMDDTLAKPFDIDKVENLIQKHCVDLVKEREVSEEDSLIAKALSGNFLKE